MSRSKTSVIALLIACVWRLAGVAPSAQAGRGRAPARAAAPVQAWRIAPTVVDARGRPTATREWAIWIPDDARRLPVKPTAEAAVGSVNMTLRETTPGR